METRQVKNAKSLHWFVRGSQLFWKSAEFLWGTIGLNVVLGAVVTLAFTAPSSLSSLPVVAWIMQNPWVVTTIFVIVLALSVISFIVSLLPPVLFAKEVKRTYLQTLIEAKKTSELKGIPLSSKISPLGVPLEEAFILLQFYPNGALTDYPPTTGEEETYIAMACRGESTPDMDRFFLEKEEAWQRYATKHAKVSIIELWQQLTIITPTAVIHGFLGMGKSTFLARLALFMARWSLDSKHWSEGNKDVDTLLPVSGQEPLIPILFSLKGYADKLQEAQDKRLDPYLLSDYLRSSLDDSSLPLPLESWDKDTLVELLKNALGAGICLVMFDGLDEVDDLDIAVKGKKRKQVQDAIKEFIQRWRTRPGTSTSFNRFLITSRMAGYDQAAFPPPNYLYFTIANLMDQQIKDFLLYWFRFSALDASRRVDPKIDEQTRERIAKEGARYKTEVLYNIISLYKGVRGLAENPLLLTLMATMLREEQFSIIKAELYKIVTQTLLVDRNREKKLEAILEADAAQRLGPLAYKIHTKHPTKNTFFVLESEAKASLRETIKSKYGGTDQQVDEEVDKFFERMRTRGGIFVQRTDHYYSFFQECFQHYYVARYLLEDIKNDGERGITRLIALVRASDQIWREPFILAVTYESSLINQIAESTIKKLLIPIEHATDEQKKQDLFLATECLIEASLSAINANLKEEVARQLLQTYQSAFAQGQTQTCSQIEDLFHRWLQSLPLGEEVYVPSLRPLTLFCNAMRGLLGSIDQHTALILLANIAAKLSLCPPKIFAQILPILLHIAELPAIGNYKPEHNSIRSGNQQLQELSIKVTVDLIQANQLLFCREVLAMILHLPVDTANEIYFVRYIAEHISDEEVQAAALSALGRSSPQTPEAIRALELGKQSTSALVQAKVHARLLGILQNNAQL